MEYSEKFKVTRDQLGDLCIECRNGFVYEVSPQTLGVWLETLRPTQTHRALTMRFPGAKLAQIGEAECTITFRPSNDKETVRFFYAVGAHRRRKLSPVQKDRATERLRAHQFKPGDARRTPARSPESTITRQAAPKRGRGLGEAKL